MRRRGPSVELALAVLAGCSLVVLWSAPCALPCAGVEVSPRTGTTLLYLLLFVPWCLSGIAWAATRFRRREGDDHDDQRLMARRLAKSVFGIHTGLLTAIVIVIAVFHDQLVLVWLPALYRLLGLDLSA